MFFEDVVNSLEFMLVVFVFGFVIKRGIGIVLIIVVDKVSFSLFYLRSVYWKSIMCEIFCVVCIYYIR